jgi:hypothetical protein
VEGVAQVEEPAYPPDQVATCPPVFLWSPNRSSFVAVENDSASGTRFAQSRWVVE